METVRDHQTGSKPFFVFVQCLFLISCQTEPRWGSKRTHNLIYRLLRDLCVRWSFFGRCCVRGRCIQLFFMWADIPLAHYQIVDLEDIFYLLRNCILSDDKLS